MKFNLKGGLSTIEFDDAVRFAQRILRNTFVKAKIFFGDISNLQHHKFVVAAIHGECFIFATYNFHFYLNIKPVYLLLDTNAVSVFDSYEINGLLGNKWCVIIL